MSVLRDRYVIKLSLITLGEVLAGDDRLDIVLLQVIVSHQDTKEKFSI